MFLTGKINLVLVGGPIVKFSLSRKRGRKGTRTGQLHRTFKIKRSTRIRLHPFANYRDRFESLPAEVIARSPPIGRMGSHSSVPIRPPFHDWTATGRKVCAEIVTPHKLSPTARRRDAGQILSRVRKFNEGKVLKMVRNQLSRTHSFYTLTPRLRETLTFWNQKGCGASPDPTGISNFFSKISRFPALPR